MTPISKTTQPILIAGAGPVGLTLAAELARYRVPVRIVDKTPAPTDKSKALAVWPRTLELLDRAGCGLAEVTPTPRILPPFMSGATVL